MKIPMNAVTHTVELLLRNDAKSATKYLSDREVVRATRILYGGKIVRRYKIEIVLNIGKPNYDEREFIKKCKKAGEPFPVKKIQLKFPTKKK